MSGLAVALLVLVGLFGAGRYAVANHGVALLDGVDALWGGRQGYRVARAAERYGSDPAQHVEVIVPAGAGSTALPVLVFFHGGGWDSGAPGDYHFIGRSFARRGYVVVLAGYRLGPQGVFPRMLEDSAAVLRWVQDNVAKHRGDPQRVQLLGHSAGAYNAVMLALDRQWLAHAGVRDHFIKGVVGLAGPYDFYPFTTDSAQRAFGAAPDPALTQPITFVRGDAPPLLLLHGDADTTVKPRNSLALAKALTALGASAQVELLAGVSHKGIMIKLAQPFNRDTRVEDAAAAFLALNSGAASPPVQAQAR